MTLLEVKNLKKIYTTRFGGNKVQALNNVNFSVEKGEFVAIMGESGSGKTTLLNILATLDKPTSGDVLLDGKSLGHLSDKEISTFRRKNLGFVFQDFCLLDGLSVKDNILLPRIISGQTEEAMEEDAARLCRIFGIEHIRDKYPAEISGGEKQRTAVARALINSPLLMLADEPTGNLDSKSSRTVIQSFERAREELDTTIFMVTHDSFAASFCDRVIILKDGEIFKTAYCSGSHRDFQKELLEIIEEMGEEGEEKE